MASSPIKGIGALGSPKYSLAVSRLEPGSQPFTVGAIDPEGSRLRTEDIAGPRRSIARAASGTIVIAVGIGGGPGLNAQLIKFPPAVGADEFSRLDAEPTTGIHVAATWDQTPDEGVEFGA
jgi:hypothetical protein